MKASVRLCVNLIASGILPAISTNASENMYFSANEGKVHLVDGVAVAFDRGLTDRLFLVNTENPGEEFSIEVGNSVIGPPSSLAYSVESGWVLVSDSIRLEDGSVKPESIVSCVPFNGHKFGIPQRVRVGPQPSGIDLNRAGEVALVANRFGGSISVLRLKSGLWQLADTLNIANSDIEITDVTITPDDRHALYVVRNTGKLGFLTFHQSNEAWNIDDFQLDLEGYPYRVVCSPDGTLAYINLAATESGENGRLAFVKLDGVYSRVLDYFDLGFPNPETVEISDCGKWLAVPLMAGSNLPEKAGGYSPTGRVVIYRAVPTPEHFQVLECGAIPEGAAFSADALELVVQCHPAREIWVYRRADLKSEFELSRKIPTTGFPSALIPAR